MGLFDNWFGGNQTAEQYAQAMGHHMGTGNAANWSPMGLPAPNAGATALPSYMSAPVTASGMNWQNGYQPALEGAGPIVGNMPTGGGFKSWISNGQNLGALAQGFGALSSAYLGFQNLRAAKDQLNFQRDAFSKNFANQTKSYNTSLEDRIRGRSANPNESDVQAYLAKHSLGG